MTVNSKTPKVMLIEDDETMLRLLRTLLEVEGYNVARLGGDGALADIMSAVRQEMPDLVLLDVHLKQANGFDLLRSMRQDEVLKPVRVLMSSGMELSYRCLKEGADDFILKPYMPDELLEKITHTLGN